MSFSKGRAPIQDIPGGELKRSVRVSLLECTKACQVAGVSVLPPEGPGDKTAELAGRGVRSLSLIHAQQAPFDRWTVEVIPNTTSLTARERPV